MTCPAELTSCKTIRMEMKFFMEKYYGSAIQALKVRSQILGEAK